MLVLWWWWCVGFFWGGVENDAVHRPCPCTLVVKTRTRQRTGLIIHPQSTPHSPTPTPTHNSRQQTPHCFLILTDLERELEGPLGRALSGGTRDDRAADGEGDAVFFWGGMWDEARRRPLLFLLLLLLLLLPTRNNHTHPSTSID